MTNENDESLDLQDSLEVIQKLGKDVRAMAIAKDLMKEKISNLDKKIAKADKNENVSIPKIKDEILKDIEPILSKINPSNIKEQLKVELRNILDVEIAKIKSETSSNSTKNLRSLTQKLSSLESQILESVSNSSKIQKELGKVKDSYSTQFKSELEDSVKTKISDLNSNFANELNKNKLNIDELKESFKKYEKDLKNLETLKISNGNDNKKLSPIKAKLTRLENANKELLKSIEKIDNQIDKKVKSESSQVEKRIKKLLDRTESSINKFSQDKLESKKLITSQINSIRKDMESFEEKIKVIETQNEDVLSNDFEAKTKELKELVLSIEKKTEESLKIISKEKDAQKDFLIKEYNSIAKELENLENKYEKQAKLKLEKLKKELEIGLEEAEARFKKEILSFDTSRENEVKGVIERLEKNNEIFLDDIKNKYGEINSLVESKIVGTVKAYEKDKSKFDNDFTKFKLDLSKVVDKHFEKSNEQLKILRKESKDLDKSKDNILKVLDNKINSEVKLFEEKLGEASAKFESFISNIDEEKLLQIKSLKEQTAELLDKFEKLSIENEAHLSLIETKLESNIKGELKTFDLKLEEISTKSNSYMENLEADKKNTLDYLKQKSNELIDNFNNLSIQNEAHLNSIESKVISDVKDKLKIFDEKLEEISTKSKSLMENLEVSKENIEISVKDEVKNLQSKFDKFIKDNIKSTNLIESKVINNVKEELKVFDEKLEEISTKSNSYLENLEVDKKNTLDYLKQKSNELIDNFTKLSLENEAHLTVLSTKASKELENKLNETHKQVTDKLAKDIISNNEFLNKIKLEAKEDRRALAEDIENKLVTSKLQFEESLKEQISNFDKILKNKEQEFEKEIKELGDEKDGLIIELSSFKNEIGILTKEYINRLDNELQNLKNVELNFESEKESFLTHIDNLVQAKKLELQDYGETIEVQLNELLKNQKETFDNNENSFREIFNEKIINLREIQEKRLDKIEKKFVEKNLKYVTNKIDSQLQYLDLFDKKLESKEQELEEQFKILESTKNLLSEQFSGELVELKEKIEERLVTGEQKFNKRFIDYDSTITQFKTVIIEEVEDLMKEVNKTVNPKIGELNNAISHVQNLGKDIENNLIELKKNRVIMEKEFSNIRDEVHDLKLGFEGSTHLKLGGMNNLVQNMNEYENQLIDLVRSLKSKGINNQSILDALTRKGHPRMYAMMIINNIDSLYLK